MLNFTRYIKELQIVPYDELTEHSKRSALEMLLQNAAASVDSSINILHEPKRLEKFGAPDFKIYKHHSIIGYVENKKISENLDKILKSEQIKKYCELSPNLLLTNYIEFIWIKGDFIERESLCNLADLENADFKLNLENAGKVEKLLHNFFSQIPDKIIFPQELALALAVRCKNLKNFIELELSRQVEKKETERLFDLFNAFKEHIFNELSISEFSDAFAQMLVYGLFLAGLNSENRKISVINVKQFIPASFQLIKELISFFDELEKPEYKETKWIIDEIISIINNIEWFDLKQNLSFNKRITDDEGIETDPYIYFYETFLTTYDYNLRKAKGVYYTPPHVVNFIIRAIDDILKSSFGLPTGISDKNQVTVLDFATGTGTFLIEIFKLILENYANESSFKRDLIIKEHILKNIYGFEYLIAPYTIAHLKLSQFLKDSGYEFQEKERLQVYLTNTLEPVDRQVVLPFLPQLTRETQTAQKVKDTPILVITGNPPYSYASKNNGEWITSKIKDYYKVDNEALKERNPKGLQDDYVKFIRFAQDKMDKTEQGIVGIITNHSFLDNPTFRGMRQSLLNTFDQLYFIDLHGNSLKKETTPEGNKDENVFDIKQGVCISIFIKRKGLEKGIFHKDFYGLRKEKFLSCLESSINTIDFTAIKPNSPFYLFIPQNQENREKYEKFWSLKDIFELNSVGIVSSNDDLFISFKEKEIRDRYYFIKNNEIQNVRYKYNLSKNFIEKKKKIFENLKQKPLEIREINYRPFDRRFIWWDTELLERVRLNVMQHFDKENIGISTVRSCQGARKWEHTFVTDSYSDMHIIPIGAYIFPLYTYNGNGNNNSNGNDYLFKEDGKKDNFTKNFRNFIKSKYSTNIVNQIKINKLEAEIEILQKVIKQIEEIIVSLRKINFDEELIKTQIVFIENLNQLVEGRIKKIQEEKECGSALYQPSPMEIFAYIYTILHSKTYRQKYSEFLKMDFPRIPFTNDLNVFKKLSEIGRELIQKHLLKEIPNEDDYRKIGNFKGEGNNVVKKLKLKTDKNKKILEHKLFINKTQYFETITEEIFNFQIGGYPVLERYFKDRKDRPLENEEIVNLEKTIKVLAFTIKQMDLIDNLTNDWI